MVTQTANYSWDKPDPGGDKDIWGTLQNGALDGVDAQVKSNEDAGVQNASDVGDNAAAIGVNAAAIAALEAAVAQLLIDVVPAIGDILVTHESDNPGDTRYPTTTWVALEGRVIVGVGPSGSNDNKNWTLDEIAGNETVTLSPSQMASHDHGAGTLTYGLNRVDRQSQAGGTTYVNNTGNDVTAGVTGRTASQGADSAHQNLQPSVAKHIWQRTA